MALTCKTIYTDNNGYCFYNIDFPRQESKIGILYFIPELEININEGSYRMLKNSNERFFYGIQDKDGVYRLKPLKKDDLQIMKTEKPWPKELTTYTKSKVLGEGSYGKVTGYDTENYVLKESLNMDDFISPDIIKEIAIYRYLKEINGLCIPRFHGFKLGKKIEIQMEKGITTLQSILENVKREDANRIMFRLAKCLKLISSQGIVNFDLKPANMVIVSDSISKWGQDEKERYTRYIDNIKQVQIIDWGLAELIYTPKRIQRTKQTLWWRSPECLHSYYIPVDYKADIFSLGLIFYQLYTNKPYPIFMADDETQQKRTILRYITNIDRNKVSTIASINLEFKKALEGPSTALKFKELILSGNHYFNDAFNIKGEKFDPNFADLLSKMLEINPIYRIDYDDIILHPYFQGMKRESLPRLPLLLNEIKPLKNISPRDHRSIIFKTIKKVMTNSSNNAKLLALQIVDLLFNRDTQNFPEENMHHRLTLACFVASSIYDEIPLEYYSIVDELNFSPNSNLMLKYFNQIFEVFDGNFLIPTLWSYCELKNEECNFNKIVEYYLSDNIYKVPFRDVDLSRFF